MSGTITTQRGFEWSEAPQDLIPALRLAALPVARIDEGAVSTRELVSADVLTVAGDVPPPEHHSYTNIADHLINAHTTFFLVDQTVTGATEDQFVIFDRPDDGNLSFLFIFEGFVSAPDHVKIYVRNPTAANFTLKANCVINYLLL